MSQQKGKQGVKIDLKCMQHLQFGLVIDSFIVGQTKDNCR